MHLLTATKGTDEIILKALTIDGEPISASAHRGPSATFVAEHFDEVAIGFIVALADTALPNLRGPANALLDLLGARAPEPAAGRVPTRSAMAVVAAKTVLGKLDEYSAHREAEDRWYRLTGLAMAVHGAAQMASTVDEAAAPLRDAAARMTQIFGTSVGNLGHGNCSQEVDDWVAGILGRDDPEATLEERLALAADAAVPLLRAGVQGIVGRIEQRLASPVAPPPGTPADRRLSTLELLGWIRQVAHIRAQNRAAVDAAVQAFVRELGARHPRQRTRLAGEHLRYTLERRDRVLTLRAGDVVFAGALRRRHDRRPQESELLQLIADASGMVMGFGSYGRARLTAGEASRMLGG